MRHPVSLCSSRRSCFRSALSSNTLLFPLQRALQGVRKTLTHSINAPSIELKKQLKSALHSNMSASTPACCVLCREEVASAVSAQLAALAKVRAAAGVEAAAEAAAVDAAAPASGDAAGPGASPAAAGAGTAAGAAPGALRLRLQGCPRALETQLARLLLQGGGSASTAEAADGPSCPSGAFVLDPRQYDTVVMVIQTEEGIR